MGIYLSEFQKGFGTAFLKSSDMIKNSSCSQFGMGEAIELSVLGGDHMTSDGFLELNLDSSKRMSDAPELFDPMSEFLRQGLGEDIRGAVVLSFVPN